MRIIGIDPSFTHCGIACVEDGQLIAQDCFGEEGKTYAGNDEMNNTAWRIATSVAKFVREYNPDKVIIEYPAQSPSGFYLMALHGWIVSYLFGIYPLYSVPPTACDSLIKNKSHKKSYIVKYCKDHNWVPPKRINNDICTAVVLTHLLEAHLSGEYKNKVFHL